MRPPCELIVRYVLPAFRSLVAKELIEKHSFTQVAAAEKLGTTQAAISQYLYSKRGDRMLKRIGGKSVVHSVVGKVARRMASGKSSPTDAMLDFCKLCFALRDREVVCDMHRDSMELPKSCNICVESPEG